MKNQKQVSDIKIQKIEEAQDMRCSAALGRAFRQKMIWTKYRLKDLSMVKTELTKTMQGVQAQIAALDKYCDTQLQASKGELARMGNNPRKYQIGMVTNIRKEMISRADECMERRKQLTQKASFAEAQYRRNEKLVKEVTPDPTKMDCSWKGCPKATCVPCMGNLQIKVEVVADPVTFSCGCLCSCVAPEPPTPASFKCKTRRKVYNPDDPQCRSHVMYRKCRCNEAPRVKGCHQGKFVNFQCGCETPNNEFFTVKQFNDPTKANRWQSVLPTCRVPDVHPDHLSDADFGAWWRVCRMKEKVTRLPMDNKCAPVLGPKKKEKALKAPLKSSQGSTDSKVLGKGGNHNQNFNHTVVDKKQQRGADKTAMQAPGNEQHEKWLDVSRKNEIKRLTAIMLGKQKALSKKKGLRFGDNLKTWVHEGKGTDGTTTCRAVFMAGNAFCNRGEFIDVDCNENPKSKSLTRVHCDCEGVMLEGQLWGRMKMHQAKACVELMAQWSEAAKVKFMRVSSSAVCAAKVQKGCLEVGVKAAFRKKMKKDTFKFAQNEIENKLEVKKTMIKSIDNSEEKTAEKVARQVMKPAKYKYTRIPGFKMGHGVMPPGDISKCRGACTTHGKCKGFSYNPVTSRCVWSTQTLDYDHRYTLNVKHRKASSSPVSFTSLPGIKMGKIVMSIEDQNRLQITKELSSKSGKKLKKKQEEDLFMKRSENECSLSCLKADACASYSYSQELGLCFISTVRMEIGSDWDYYERVPADGVSPQQKLIYMETKQRKARKLINNIVGQAEDDIREYEGGPSHDDNSLQPKSRARRLLAISAIHEVQELGNGDAHDDSHQSASLDATGDSVGEGMGVSRRGPGASGFISTIGSWKLSSVSDFSAQLTTGVEEDALLLEEAEGRSLGESEGKGGPEGFLETRGSVSLSSSSSAAET